jgi:hypothetical protein
MAATTSFRPSRWLQMMEEVRHLLSRLKSEAKPANSVASGVLEDGLQDPRERRSRLEMAQRMETLGRLTGGITHDFHNLLTVIQGYRVPGR